MKKLGICLVLLGLCSFAMTGCAKKETPKPKAPAATGTTAPADEKAPADPAPAPADPAK